MLACGLGGELERRGFTRMLRSPLWSALALVEAPDLLEEIHYDQFSSGIVQYVSSCSYQASVEAFQRELGGKCSDAQAEELLRQSIRLVRRAAERWLHECGCGQTGFVLRIVASCGTFAAQLADGSEYSGQLGGRTVVELMEFHRRRLDILLQEQPDLIAFETIPSLLEVEAICRLLSSDPTLIERTWLSVCCRDGEHLNDGTLLVQGLRLITQIMTAGGRRVRLFGVGVNCTEPQYVSQIVATIRAELPPTIYQHIVCYPNSGERWDASERRWLPASDGRNDFTQCMINASRQGATILGGCCRVTLDDLRDLYSKIN